MREVGRREHTRRRQMKDVGGWVYPNSIRSGPRECATDHGTVWKRLKIRRSKDDPDPDR